MKKTLWLPLRKLLTRSLRHANIYIADGGVMKLLRTDEYFEGSILHLG